jgi:uncharacterized protein (TIGR04552 family)
VRSFASCATDSLLPFEKIFEFQPATRRFRTELQSESEINIPSLQPNFFSSASYRVINFVADLPLRVGQIIDHVGLQDVPFEHSAVVYVLTEFQVMDAQTAITNEQGESSHEAYKERQHIEVKARLTRGLRSRPAKDAPK